MLVAQLQGPRTVAVIDMPEPELRPGSLIIEIDRCGIGGSDVGAWLSGEVPSPAWFGHEWVGRVVAVAEDVADHFPGERVLGAVPPPCGACRPCRVGLADQCDLVIDIIVGTDPLASGHGAFAERIRVDARRVMAVPEALDDQLATLTEPAAVAAHAVARNRVRLGDVAVVIGAGPIGLLVAEIVRQSGAASVVVIEPDRRRRETACDLGADAAFAPGAGAERWLAERTGQLGADLVYDCAGTAASLASTIGYVRRGGAVVVAGVSPGAQLPWSPKTHERELTVRASLGYTIGDVRRVLALMADDRLRLTPILDPNPLTLAELPAALAELAERPAGWRKRIVAPNP